MLCLVYFSLWPFPGLYSCRVSIGRNNVLGENDFAYLRLSPVLARSS
jgi:hypothetical protein